MLFGIEPTDPMTLAGIIGVLTLAVLAACWIPVSPRGRCVYRSSIAG